LNPVLGETINVEELNGDSAVLRKDHQIFNTEFQGCLISIQILRMNQFIHCFLYSGSPSLVQPVVTLIVTTRCTRDGEPEYGIQERATGC
jgi:hypothetical protein